MSDKYEKINESRYRRFIFTLNQCGEFLLDAKDESIETCIFENFDIGIRGDISDTNLELFIDRGWIDENIKEKCIKLREQFLDIQANHMSIWNIYSVRTSDKWKEIMKLSDEIKSLIYFELNV